MSLLRFTVQLLRVLWHAARERYYAIALNHVGPTHPDAWLLTRRMLMSKSVVNDFLRKVSH